MASVRPLLIVLAACGGTSKYRTSPPPPLAPHGPPRPAADVRIEARALPWWTLAGTNDEFILQLNAAPAATRGRSLGALRSSDVFMEANVFAAVRCAWMIVPMGEGRPCAGKRADAMAAAQVPIHTAFDELRTRAGEAGASVVGDVRCFARDDRRGARIWCEGSAIATNDERPAPPVVAALPAPPAVHGVFDPTGTSAPPPAPATDPSAPIAHEPPLPGTRLVLHADGSFGMLGRVPMVGSTLGLRYRPIELGLLILDLSRDGTDRRLVGLGGSLLARIQIGRSRADAVIGIAATAIASNGSTNPKFNGLYQTFAGMAYQTPWRWMGAAQPFVQLRAGMARGSELAPRGMPMLDLHIGLSSPERR